MSTDTLFPLPDAAPDRLTAARIELERAESVLAQADDGEEMQRGSRAERDAVAIARQELCLAEIERLRCRP